MTRFVGLLSTVNDDRWDHMNGWGGGWMWLWGIAMMALLVVLIVWLVRARTENGAPSSLPKDPTDRARELTTEEYRERVDHLR